MFSRYRRFETSYPPQFHERELVPFSPSYHSYHNARNDVGDHHSLQKRRFGHNYAEGLPTSAYPTSKMETTSLNSPTSSDLQSNITMSEFSFPDDCTGPRGNVNESLNFSGRTEFMLPQNNLPPLSKDALLDQSASFNSMALPKALDSSFTLYTALEPAKSHQTSFGPVGLESLSHVAMWNLGLLSPDNDLFIVGDAGWYHVNTSHSMTAINIFRTLDHAIR
jgi:hypothetical protein